MPVDRAREALDEAREEAEEQREAAEADAETDDLHPADAARARQELDEEDDPDVGEPEPEPEPEPAVETEVDEEVEQLALEQVRERIEDEGIEVADRRLGPEHIGDVDIRRVDGEIVAEPRIDDEIRDEIRRERVAEQVEEDIGPDDVVLTRDLPGAVTAPAQLDPAVEADIATAEVLEEFDEATIRDLDEDDIEIGPATIPAPGVAADVPSPTGLEAQLDEDIRQEEAARQLFDDLTDADLRAADRVDFQELNGDIAVRADDEVEMIEDAEIVQEDDVIRVEIDDRPTDSDFSEFLDVFPDEQPRELAVAEGPIPEGTVDPTARPEIGDPGPLAPTVVRETAADIAEPIEDAAARGREIPVIGDAASALADLSRRRDVQVATLAATAAAPVTPPVTPGIIARAPAAARTGLSVGAVGTTAAVAERELDVPTDRVGELEVPEESIVERGELAVGADVVAEEIEVPEDVDRRIDAGEIGIPEGVVERAEITGPEGAEITDEGEIVIPAEAQQVVTREQIVEEEDIDDEAIVIIDLPERGEDILDEAEVPRVIDEPIEEPVDEPLEELPRERVEEPAIEEPVDEPLREIDETAVVEPTVETEVVRPRDEPFVPGIEPVDETAAVRPEIDTRQARTPDVLEAQRAEQAAELEEMRALREREAVSTDIGAMTAPAQAVATPAIEQPALEPMAVEPAEAFEHIQERAQARRREPLRPLISPEFPGASDLDDDDTVIDEEDMWHNPIERLGSPGDAGPDADPPDLDGPRWL